jgi:glycosyltransferase involved in cell wall biosynthesis
MNETIHRFSISFIIPVLNGEKCMAQCIEHIIAEMGEDDELIVVDNGSTDATLDIVRRYDRARILEFPGSTIAFLRNRGVEVARGDLYAFIDSDVIICEGWRAEVESALGDESIHATGSKYDIPEKPHWIERAWYSKRSKDMRPINYINSGNLIVRKSAFEAVSGFNEKLVTDEDCDLGERLNRNGYAVVEAPLIRAIHLGNPRSLWNFFKKEKWHATSSLNSLTQGIFDKPTTMTFAFMVCLVAMLVSIPWVLSGEVNPIILPALLLFIPAVTAVYRSYQFKAFRHILAFVVLYFVFFVARALIILQFLFGRTLERVFSGRESS